MQENSRKILGKKSRKKMSEKKCEKCDGTGQVECEGECCECGCDCGNEVDCDECGGIGVIKDE